MQPKILLSAIVLLAATTAGAGEYECKVYCTNPSGSTTITVQASSASEAAQQVDKLGHQVCRAAGYGQASSSNMSASQCR